MIPVQMKIFIVLRLKVFLNFISANITNMKTIIRMVRMWHWAMHVQAIVRNTASLSACLLSLMSSVYILYIAYTSKGKKMNHWYSPTTALM